MDNMRTYSYVYFMCNKQCQFPLELEHYHFHISGKSENKLLFQDTHILAEIAQIIWLSVNLVKKATNTVLAKGFSRLNAMKLSFIAAYQVNINHPNQKKDEETLSLKPNTHARMKKKKPFPPKIPIAILICLTMLLAAASISHRPYSVYATSTGTRYHIKACYHLKDKVNLSRMSIEQAKEKRLVPCKDCSPNTKKQDR